MLKRHLVILFVVTVIVRGIMFISYPMGGVDDDQSAQRYLIDELVDGNWKIGNLRYNTGYAFFIAPVAAVAQPFGRLEDRIILLVQILLSSTVPFLVYDIIRSRRSGREALIVALVVALDIFGLQWAHWAVPVWWVAWGLMVALWLINRALRTPGSHWWLWIVSAGLVFGVAILGRTEAAVLAATLGLAFLALQRLPWRRRLLILGLFGGGVVGVFGMYLVVVQKASTGTMRPSCMTGVNLLLSAYSKDIRLEADTGPQTRHLLALLALDPPREVVFSAADYPNWRKPGTWATPGEEAAFLDQPTGEPKARVETSFPGDLIYFMGLCPTNELLNEVILESVKQQPGRWLVEVLGTAGQVLVHDPDPCCEDLYLPRYNLLTLRKTENDVLNAVGFRIAGGEGSPRRNKHPFNPGGEFYTGQYVWAPGIWGFSGIFDRAMLVFWLTPLAMIWALGSRDWFYRVVVVMLLAGVLVVSVFNMSQPRIYASFYPLYAILIGGLLAVAARWLMAWRDRRRET